MNEIDKVDDRRTLKSVHTDLRARLEELSFAKMKSRELIAAMHLKSDVPKQGENIEKRQEPNDIVELFENVSEDMHEQIELIVSDIERVLGMIE